MEAEENKAVARRLWECLDSHDFDAVDELVSPDFVNHVDGRKGVEPWKEIFRGADRTFPDMRWGVDLLVAEGDTVVVFATLEGTHTGGPFFGLEPSGKHFRWETVHVYHLADGRIIDHRAVRNDLGLLLQLGGQVGPAPG